ncbi:hypothetical protein VQ042_23100 [Aurantimonas sp. A2-1-M11]|uniref:hypothetical protein n=1 Tax=Aurantimonas sp. A2-1-M11 TaxID=3113712 RepID=UPI002F95066C
MVSDKPVSDTILISLLKRLRGFKDGKKVADDQLAAAGLPHFTLHEIRDSLTTHLASHTSLPSGTASAILDHASNDDGDHDNKEASVTREYYNKSERLGLKYAGLEAWAEAVFHEYENIDKRYRLERSRGQLARRPVMPTKKTAKRVRERAEAEWAALAQRSAIIAKQPISLDLAKLPRASDEIELEPHEFVSLSDE